MFYTGKFHLETRSTMPAAINGTAFYRLHIFILSPGYEIRGVSTRLDAISPPQRATEKRITYRICISTILKIKGSEKKKIIKHLQLFLSSRIDWQTLGIAITCPFLSFSSFRSFSSGPRVTRQKQRGANFECDGRRSCPWRD